MAPKRKRAPAPALAAGERLNRDKLFGNRDIGTSAWGWVETEVTNPADITLEHRLRTCGLSRKNKPRFCANKYATTTGPPLMTRPSSEAEDTSTTSSSLEGKDASNGAEDIITIISDTEEEKMECTKKSCRGNPFCLNHLGQDFWEDDDKAENAFLSALNFVQDPSTNTRVQDEPVGLRNLGATCYANASLQVWFRDRTFRAGVYQCQTLNCEATDMETHEDPSPQYARDSPIYQLQLTFAAMQVGNQKVFNPERLVESLQLNTLEQQDAQEFSKLFVSHLDDEFQKQTDPSVRNLVANQFQGQQVYGTTCCNCGTTSERLSDFLEIEISFQNNDTLESRLESLFVKEKLEGDNQYLCSQCESLQDAWRYWGLRSLPPILHFSLLRFAYDFESGDKKKLKHIIHFPSVLDMSRFLPEDSREGQMYELRGVLLHKGTSAHQGHYEAQVYDVNDKTWYQCNDDIVTKLDDSLVPKQDDAPNAKVTKNGNIRKRKRADDDNIVELQTGSLLNAHESKHSSKDAYMLIYARCNPRPTQKSDSGDIPATVRHDILEMNSAHGDICARYEDVIRLACDYAQNLSDDVKKIYRTWNNYDIEGSLEEVPVAVHRILLEKWLSKNALESKVEAFKKLLTHEQCTFLQTKSSKKEGQHDEITNTSPFQIRCQHGHLDPRHLGNIKCLSKSAWNEVSRDFSDTSPLYTDANDVCSECIADKFSARLFEIQHPRLVNEFDQVCSPEDDEPAFWISKEWLRDWRLIKPKMHSIQEPNGPPPDYDILCEHGALFAKATQLRKVSQRGFELLKGLFPQWEPIPADSHLCEICDESSLSMSPEKKRELRKKAEDEKARLIHLYLGDTASSNEENGRYAILATSFLKDWKTWIDRPLHQPRPTQIDHNQFLCAHRNLQIDPNSSLDWDADYSVIVWDDWEIILQLGYDIPVSIGLSRQPHASESSPPCFISDIPVCTECWNERHRNYTQASLRLQVHQDPASFTGGNKLKGPRYKTYGAGTRRSARVEMFQREKEKTLVMLITQETTVKDIKVWLQDKINVPAICLKLEREGGHEIADSGLMMNQLAMLAGETLQVHVQREVAEEEVNLLVTDEEEDDQHALASQQQQKKKRKARVEEKGFQGTLLGRSMAADNGNSQGPTAASSTTHTSSSPAPETVATAPATEVPMSDLEIACKTCTFLNPIDGGSQCAMCGLDL